MKRLNTRFTSVFSVFIVTVALLTSIAFGQNISGVYLNTTDFGPSHIVVNQLDETISVELTDDRTSVNLMGIIEDNTLLFDTSDMPFTLIATLSQNTITMFFQAKDSEEDSLELSFIFDSALPIAARASTNTLSKFLHFIPNTEIVYNSDLFYTNLWALSGFRNAAVIQSQDDYLNFQFTEAYSAYSRNAALLMNLPFDSSNSVTTLLEEMPDTVGFSWFDIQASLSYGSSRIARPPNRGNLVYTTVARDPITIALQKLGFAKELFQESEVWTLGEEGELEPKLINAANPFGGELGESANVFLTDTVIGYAPYNTVIRDQVRSYNNEIDSLATNPGFKFLVEQLEAEDTKDAVLAQVYFPPVDDFKLSAKFLDHFKRYLRGTLEGLFSEISTFKSVLPKYQHVAVAHYFEKDTDFIFSSASIHLLYDDLDDAVKARAELYNRLTLYYQHLPEITVHPTKLINSIDETHFVVSVKVEDPNSALDERLSLAEPYSIWMGELFRGLFMPIYYTE